MLKSLPLLVLLLSQLAAHAVTPLPPSLDEATPSPTIEELRSAWPLAADVILAEDRRFSRDKQPERHRGEDHHRVLVQVLDPQRSEYVDLRFDSMPKECTVRVRRPGGPVVSYSGADFLTETDRVTETSGGSIGAERAQRIFVNSFVGLAKIIYLPFRLTGIMSEDEFVVYDDEDHVLALPDIVPGTLVEITTSTNAPTVVKEYLDHFQLRRAQPVLHTSFEFITERKNPAATWSPLGEPEILDGPDKTVIHRWTAGPLPAHSGETYTSLIDENGWPILAAPEGFESSRIPLMSRHMTTWLASGEELEWKQKLKSLLPAPLPSDADSVAALLDGLRQRLEKHYLSSPTYKLSVCWNQKQGGPMERAAMAVLICRAAGFNAKAGVLVNRPVEQPGFDLVKPKDVGDVAVMVWYGGRWHIAFPQYDDLGPDTLPQHVCGWQVLDLEDKEHSWNLEGDLGPAVEREWTVAVELDEQGGCSVTERHILRGHDAWYLRRMLKKERAAAEAREKKDRKSGGRQEDSTTATAEGTEAEEPEGTNSETVSEWVKDLITYQESEVENLQHEISGVDEPKEPLELEITYRITGKVSMMPGETLFDVQGLFAPTSGARFLVDPGKREAGIVVYGPQHFVKEITVTYPGTWELNTEDFHDFRRENDFGFLEGKHSFEPGVFRLRQEQRLVPLRQPREAWGDFLTIKLRGAEIEVPAMTFLSN